MSNWSSCHILVFCLFLKPALNMVFEKKTNPDFKQWHNLFLFCSFSFFFGLPLSPTLTFEEKHDDSITCFLSRVQNSSSFIIAHMMQSDLHLLTKSYAWQFSSQLFSTKRPSQHSVNEASNLIHSTFSKKSKSVLKTFLGLLSPRPSCIQSPILLPILVT